MIKKYFRYWYDISAVIAIITTVILFVFWSNFTFVEKLILGNFIFMQLHFFEEFHVPGGFPGVANIAEFHSDKPSHYPLNQASAAFGNNWFGIFVYLIPLFFTDVSWLVLSPMVFGFLELFMHAIVFNKMMHVKYNPGLITSVVGFTPIGILYIIYAAQNGLLSIIDFVLAIGYPALTYLIIFQFIGIKIMSNPNTKYPFAPEEMERYNKYLK